MALERAMEEIRAGLEGRIKGQLSGLQGFIVGQLYNSMMPLRVEISLAPGVFEFVFLKDGVVKLSHGYGSNVDLRIVSDAETFTSLFQNPSTEAFNELERDGKIRITSLTSKGKDAEGYIRKYLAR